MTDELKRAQDMLTLMEEERNSLANRLVHARADTAAANRRVQELEAKIAELGAPKASVGAPDPAQPPHSSQPNGAVEAEALH